MSFIKSILSFFTKNNEQPQENSTTLNTNNANNSVESSIQYIQEGNVLYHTDGTDIEDKEIPYLIEIGLLNAIEREKVSPNPKFHRTEEEKKLSFKFFQEKFDYLRQQEHNLIDLNQKANETITDIDVTISDCKKAIKTFYDLKNECYQTKEGMLYFKDMWEHCHNSQNPCFCFIEKTEKRLQDLTENYAERKKYYEKRQYVKNNLKNDVITLISNNENILQKDVYSHFDADLKDSIARLLNNMDRKGEIKRVKHGSTYQLSIK
ncbi:MAG: hypothetical protein HFE58_04685 [Firmicutes bacterium]|nr:hypothetical protein [Bacillota bacterium]